MFDIIMDLDGVLKYNKECAYVCYNTKANLVCLLASNNYEGTNLAGDRYVYFLYNVVILHYFEKFFRSYFLQK